MLMEKKGKIKNCVICNKEFYVNPCRITTSKFCSYQCKGLSIVKKKCKKCGEEFSAPARKNICYKCSTKKCKSCGKDFLVPPSQFKLLSNNFCSYKCAGIDKSKNNQQLHCAWCKKVFSRSPSLCRNQLQVFCNIKCARHKKVKRGKDSPLWRGNRPRYRALRNGVGWKKWRELVFKRDGYICQACNIKGGELEPHHIFRLSKNSNLRFRKWNGITLCSKCHQKTKKFDKKYNGTKEELKCNLYKINNVFKKQLQKGRYL